MEELVRPVFSPTQDIPLTFLTYSQIRLFYSIVLKVKSCLSSADTILLTAEPPSCLGFLLRLNSLNYNEVPEVERLSVNERVESSGAASCPVETFVK
jgi:hypothetical protein